MKIKGSAPTREFQEQVDDMVIASKEMMEACWVLHGMSKNLSEKEFEAEQARAKALKLPQVNDKNLAKNQEMREAMAAEHWSKERKAYLEAKYERESQFEIVRCYRQRVSALQTAHNRDKMELEALNYGQDSGA